jgi:hypothetical protein
VLRFIALLLKSSKGKGMSSLTYVNVDTDRPG